MHPSLEAIRGKSTRLRQFSLRAFLLGFVVIGFLLVPIAAIVQSWQSLQVQTVALRVTASGTVTWGEKPVAVADFSGELERLAQLYRSYRFKPRLLIEYYNDADPSDIATLEAMGRDAGFDVTDPKRLQWSSPTLRHN